MNKESNQSLKCEHLFNRFWEEYRKTQSINVDDFKAVLRKAFEIGYRDGMVTVINTLLPGDE
jgi:hypothetical protein